MNELWQNNWGQEPSKLNSFEFVKLNTDGLDILEKLNTFKKAGFASISDDERDLLKWAGVYVQRPRTDGFFMMRVKIPFGIMTSEQARILARIAQKFGRGILDITTRQAIQFHWLTIENIPDVISELNSVGLSTIEACGDCPRNIIGNPLAGIDPHELLDTRDLQSELFNYFQGNRQFSNLPRKFKLSISASIFDTAHAGINDLAFTPAVKAVNNEVIKGFHVFVGGGLSSQPYLAKTLDIFVRPEEVLNLAIGVATLFRDFGSRESRKKSRLKFLVEQWGAEKFKQELEKLIGPLSKRGDDCTESWNAGYFYGVHQQKQAGLNYVGLSVPLGRLKAEELSELADLAAKYGDSSLRTTNSKNIILAGIPKETILTFLHEPLLRKLTPFPKTFISHTISCTGKEFCNFALVETRKHALRIGHHLDQVFNQKTPVRIHITGCPNSCGQLQIADIGLRGSLSRINGQAVEGFELQIGGTLGTDPGFGSKLNGFIPAQTAPQALEHLISYFNHHKLENESFHDFVLRVGTAPLQEQLSTFLALDRNEILEQPLVI